MILYTNDGRVEPNECPACRVKGSLVIWCDWMHCMECDMYWPLNEDKPLIIAGSSNYTTMVYA